MATPKVSVIIPTFNRKEVLPRAIESVLNQTFKDFELIVVNDGSTDDTEELLKNYNVKVITTDNHGVSSARNIAIESAKGEWLAFLDSDDEWLEDKLEAQIQFASEHPELNIIHGDEIWIRNGIRVNQMKKHQKFGGWIYEKCLPLCLISPSCVMIHKTIFEDVGMFDPAMIVCEDYDLWLRITKDYEVGFVNRPLINKYGGHEDQLSRKFKAMDIFRVRAMAKVIDLGLQPQQKIATLKELEKKIIILSKGYKKHGRFDELTELKDIANQFHNFLEIDASYFE